jgi:hypothetical protein
MTGIETTWYEFSEHPTSGACWSLSTGPDGRIYAASCCEGSPGQTAKVGRHAEDTDSRTYLFDLDTVVDARGSRVTRSCFR